MTTTSQPTPTSERVIALDITRGVAVLMIFVVNIKAMGSPAAYYNLSELWASPFDQFLAKLQLLFVGEKFLTLFTALFGIGLVIFCDRARAKSAGGALIARRLGVLLIIGLAHGFLIWFGDILTLYACAGVVVLAFVRKSPATLYIAGTGLLLAQFVLVAALEAGRFPPDISALFTLDRDESAAGIDADKLAYLGNVGDQLVRRSHDFVNVFTTHLGHTGLRTVAVMLFGMALYKQGFFNLQWSSRRYHTLTGVALIGGLSARTAIGLLVEGDSFPPIIIALAYVSNAAIAFGYAGLVVSALKLGLRFDPLAAAGRMALTNYIASSVIGTTLFYGHAGGLFGAFTLVQLMGVVVVVWCAMLVWSSLWLARFRYGPLEWVWRSLTYGRAQPLRPDGALG